MPKRDASISWRDPSSRRAGHGRPGHLRRHRRAGKDRTDTQAPPPTRPDQPPPAEPGMIPLTIPEIKRLLAALTTRPLPRRLVIHWDAWTRRHQARSRWFHKRARLARDRRDRPGQRGEMRLPYYARLRSRITARHPRGTFRGTVFWLIPALRVLSVRSTVLSVQLARVLHEAVLLVNGRSVVRIRSPAPRSLHVSVGPIFTFASDWSIPSSLHTWFCVTQLRQVALRVMRLPDPVPEPAFV